MGPNVNKWVNYSSYKGEECGSMGSCDKWLLRLVRDDD